MTGRHYLDIFRVQLEVHLFVAVTTLMVKKYWSKSRNKNVFGPFLNGRLQCT
jgi:hypothetical protein